MAFKSETMKKIMEMLKALAEKKMVFKNKTGLIIAFILALLIVGYATFNYVRHSEKKEVTVNQTETIPVQVAEARLTNLQRILELTGDIKPAAAVNVHPKIGGEIIKKIYVETGDNVKKGDLIAVFDDGVIKAQLEEATAGLAAAEAGLGQSEANLELLEKDSLRVENLYQENAVSKQELDNINAQYKVAVESKKLAGAQIEKAKAVLNQLQILYGEYKIYAPISGFVAARYMEQGDRSNPAQPVIRISQEDELKIACSVTEKDFPRLNKGMKAEITVDAFPEKVFKGVVAVISPTIDPATRTAGIEIHIPNEKYELRSGMFARIKLYLGERKALAVPIESLNKMPGTGS
ncbi:MAG: efflux RND transporter periplasmic adaptor subunit [Eubacteriales bacterium]